MIKKRIQKTTDTLLIVETRKTTSEHNRITENLHANGYLYAISTVTFTTAWNNKNTHTHVFTTDR